MATVLRGLRIREVSLVDKGANPGAKVVLYKRADGHLPKSFVDRIVGLFRKSLEEAQPPEPQPKEKAMDLNAILAKLTPEEQAYLKEMLSKGGGAPAPEPTQKKLEMTEEVRKVLEAEQAEKAELKKRLDEVEAMIEIEAFTKRATELSHVPGIKVEDLAKVLRDASKKLSKDDFAKLEAALKSAASAVKKSAILVEDGSSGGGSPESAYGRIRAVAKALREKDPALTEAQAIEKATNLNPELYAEHQNEARG